MLLDALLATKEDKAVTKVARHLLNRVLAATAWQVAITCSVSGCSCQPRIRTLRLMRDETERVDDDLLAFYQSR